MRHTDPIPQRLRLSIIFVFIVFIFIMACLDREIGSQLFFTPYIRTHMNVFCLSKNIRLNNNLISVWANTVVYQRKCLSISAYRRMRGWPYLLTATYAYVCVCSWSCMCAWIWDMCACGWRRVYACMCVRAIYSDYQHFPTANFTRNSSLEINKPISCLRPTILFLQVHTWKHSFIRHARKAFL